jgi:flagellar basal-body rod modification protein FlgD
MSLTSAVNNSALGTQDQFLQLLTAQLQNQDPFNPVSDTEFIAQIAQFSTLSSLQQLNASFGEILKLQQLTDGSSLLGRTVEYSNGETRASGLVQSLIVQDGQIQIAVGPDANSITDTIGLDQVNLVRA